MHPRTYGPVIWLAALLLAAVSGVAHAQNLPDFTALVDRYGQAVVSISAESEEQESVSPLSHLPIPEDSPLFEYFERFLDDLPDGGMEPVTAMGSGFIISQDGYILTNAHVVQGSNQVTVTLSDRREYKAKVVGVDPRSDVALVKIEDNGDLPVAPVGDSNNLKVGQWVLAIGSPFGLEYTATQGIISALGRSLPTETYVPFIQTDAAINPGNSGGPLFNLAGEVIGVNAQIYSQTGGYMGVSFAIPINVAMDVADQLRKFGKVSRGWLGVVVQEVSPDLAQSFGLDRPRGALVADVVPQSPAAEAGLKAGDVIIGYHGRPVERSSQLPPLVGRTPAGTRVPVTIVREGQERVIELNITELPEEQEKETGAGEPKPQQRGGKLNISVGPLPPDSPLKSGVVVSDIGPGPAARAGIREGDILVQLNNRPVESASQMMSLIEELPRDQPFPVLVHRRNQPLFLAMTIPK